MVYVTSEAETPHVVMISLWRNDANRHLMGRVSHLLEKSYERLRWLWVVGDSHDMTESLLRDVGRGHNGHHSIEIVRADTGIPGYGPEERMRRLSLTVNVGFEHVRDEDGFVVIHESDLVSPVDVVERLLATKKCPVAGWPVLETGDGHKIFYDIWAYRQDGRHFTNQPPYHRCYRADEMFEVDSVGSCWMLDAADVRGANGVRCERLAAVELCAKLRARGRRIWVDPTLEVVQPSDLYVSHALPDEQPAIGE